jgi:hypothetical protein
VLYHRAIAPAPTQIILKEILCDGYDYSLQYVHEDIEEPKIKTFVQGHKAGK